MIALVAEQSIAVSHVPEFLQAFKPTHRLDWRATEWLQPTN
ncbi:hypothetical protein ACTJKS_17800 [Pseudomonas sp. 22189]|nr:hypothetical protein [Pseudomonas koreensis]